MSQITFVPLEGKLSTMALNLAKSHYELISSMNSSELFNDDEIAQAASCSAPRCPKNTLKYLHFGSTKAPDNGRGRKQSLTPLMLDALCEHLLEKPGLYQTEMVVFIWDEFREFVTTCSIARALASRRWTKKTIRLVASGRNADLRDLYLHNLSDFYSYHLVYIDESGCDKHIRFRRTRWSPLRVTPVQVT